MFTAITRDESALGRPVSAATLHRIHATLRAALNGAVRAGLITVNPGRWPELPRAARPRPQVWTPALTDRWRPVVGVWTAVQTAQFLGQVRGHRRTNRWKAALNAFDITFDGRLSAGRK